MGVNELSTLLWREREQLELLMFKLEEEQLLLTSGKSKWLPYATREVEQVLCPTAQGQASSAPSRRRPWPWSGASATRPPCASSSDHSPSDAWRDIFTSHLTALTALTHQISSVRDTNLQYLRAATRATQETLAGMNADRGLYDGRGAAAAASSLAHLFDRQI